MNVPITCSECGAEVKLGRCRSCKPRELHGDERIQELERENIKQEKEIKRLRSIMIEQSGTIEVLKARQLNKE
jgi:hypothetical protein